MQAAGAELAALLHELGPGEVIDIDMLLMRESLDVIGRVGFDVDFGSLKVRRFPAAALLIPPCLV